MKQLQTTSNNFKQHQTISNHFKQSKIVPHKSKIVNYSYFCIKFTHRDKTASAHSTPQA